MNKLTTRSWIARLRFPVISLVLLCAVYGASLNGNFLKWDDDRFVQNNPHVSELSVSNIQWAFSDLRFESYQPLHMISYMFDGSFWAGKPIGYKIHNLVLLYLAGLLLFSLLRKMTGAEWAAVAGTALFLAAPHRVESVAWISARKDVLALVLALLVWHVHLIEPEKTWRFWMLRAAELLLFGLALLSKSSVFVLPFMILVADVAIRRRSAVRSLAGCALPIVVAVGVAVFLPMLWAKSQLVNADAPKDTLSRIGLVCWSAGHYIRSIVWPFSLSPLYAAPPFESLRMWAFGGMAIGVGGIVLSVRFRHVLHKYFSFIGALLMVAFALAPFLNVVPMYYWVADRYLLFPSVGVSVLVALAIAAIEKRAAPLPQRMVLVSLVVLVVGILSWRSAVDAMQWKQSDTMFELAVKRQPNSFWAHMKLGEVLRDAKKYAASEEQYREARRIRPLSPSALGGVYWTAFAQDISEHPELGAVDAENVTGYFVHIASSPPQLRRLLEKLKQTRCHRAASVVQERLDEMR
ncbi:MAG: hypothetical protein JXX29_09555 [Deltaproteobacteria bacterium]|nr:hypothetical protein [Deltaproteobacteria bacterium]MBN2671910.1 hypothetical protein [Deltaproteobacteria bacterium]